MVFEARNVLNFHFLHFIFFPYFNFTDVYVMLPSPPKKTWQEFLLLPNIPPYPHTAPHIHKPKALLLGNLTQKSISKCNFFVGKETHGDHLKILNGERYS